MCLARGIFNERNKHQDEEESDATEEEMPPLIPIDDLPFTVYFIEVIANAYNMTREEGTYMLREIEMDLHRISEDFIRRYDNNPDEVDPEHFIVTRWNTFITILPTDPIEKCTHFTLIHSSYYLLNDFHTHCVAKYGVRSPNRRARSAADFLILQTIERIYFIYNNLSTYIL